MSNRGEDARGLRRLWRDYSLSIVVGVLFLLRRGSSSARSLGDIANSVWDW
jgi:hypothetical protein